MNRISARRVVDAVLRARDAESTDEQIHEQLIDLGVPASHTTSVVECVEHGFKAGVLAVVTGGVSAAEIPLGKNAFFDTAFRRGKATMRFTTPGWVLLRLVGPWVLLVLLIGLVVHLAVR